MRTMDEIKKDAIDLAGPILELIDTVYQIVKDDYESVLAIVRKEAVRDEKLRYRADSGEKTPA